MKPNVMSERGIRKGYRHRASAAVIMPNERRACRTDKPLAEFGWPGTQYLIPGHTWRIPRSGSACHVTIIGQHSFQTLSNRKKGIKDQFPRWIVWELPPKWPDPAEVDRRITTRNGAK
jgi:hypothetical protein